MIIIWIFHYIHQSKFNRLMMSRTLFPSVLFISYNAATVRLIKFKSTRTRTSAMHWKCMRPSDQTWFTFTFYHISQWPGVISLALSTFLSILFLCSSLLLCLALASLISSPPPSFLSNFYSIYVPKEKKSIRKDEWCRKKIVNNWLKKRDIPTSYSMRKNNSQMEDT